MNPLDVQTRHEAFYAYYSACYPELWPSLLKALLKAPEKCAWESSYSRQEGLNPYYLDEASIWCAELLPIPKNARILDMCAAPGGKSLVLAHRMNEGDRLEANELSLNRRVRLNNNLKSYLRPEQQKDVRVTGYDATRYGICRPEEFDAILLDAPCSSERHLLQDETELARFTQSRSKTLSMRQYALLSSAFFAASTHAHILYATCSISPLENDGVIERLIKKRGAHLRLKSIELPHGQATRFGWHVLPNSTKDVGPLYLALMQKI